MNKVGLSGGRDASKPGRIVVQDSVPTGDAVLDTALTVILARQGSKPSTLIRPLGIRGCPQGDPGDDRRRSGSRQLRRSRVRRAASSGQQWAALQNSHFGRASAT